MIHDIILGVYTDRNTGVLSIENGSAVAAKQEKQFNNKKKLAEHQFFIRCFAQRLHS